MECSSKTARELYQDLQRNPARGRIGFGRKPLLVNIDLQCAYTQLGKFKTAYETDKRQIEYVNELARLARERDLPIVWTYVAYMENAADCGVWGTRSDTPDSLQNIRLDSERARFDPRLVIDRRTEAVINKHMASAFHETNLQSLMVWYQCDTLIVTGGSTSGCVRATVVDALSRGYRTVVPEECVADKHESPHFANLYDMAVKYADVLPVAEVAEFYRSYAPRSAIPTESLRAV